MGVSSLLLYARHELIDSGRFTGSTDPLYVPQVSRAELIR
jgi:hypothetical protein